MKKLEAEKDAIIEDALRVFYNKRNRLQRKITEIGRRIEAETDTVVMPYPKKGDWSDKIIWALRKMNRQSKFNDIIEMINSNEGKGDASSIVRLNVHRMSEKKEIIKYKYKEFNFIRYGLPEWFHKGKPLGDYMP